MFIYNSINEHFYFMNMTLKDKEQLKELINKYSFKCIIDELLEQKLIYTDDILHIADSYDYSENYTTIDKINDILFDEANSVSCDEFINEIVFQYFDKWDILDNFDKDDLLDKLDGSYELDNYVDNKIDEAMYESDIEHEKEIEKLIDSPTSKKGLMKTIKNIDLYPDELHEIICELVNCNKYEKNSNIIINKLKEKLRNNNYGTLY